MDTTIRCPKCGQKKLINETLLQRRYYVCSGCNEKIGISQK